MIFGTLRIEGDALSTHRDSVLLSTLTMVSVRRPFLSSALIFACGFAGFGVSFADLLYDSEIAALTGFCLFALVFGWQIG